MKFKTKEEKKAFKIGLLSGLSKEKKKNEKTSKKSISVIDKEYLEYSQKPLNVIVNKKALRRMDLVKNDLDEQCMRYAVHMGHDCNLTEKELINNFKEHVKEAKKDKDFRAYLERNYGPE